LTGTRSTYRGDYRRAGIALRIARPNDPSLISRKLGELGVAAYASRQDLAAHGRPKRGSGLKDHSLIDYPVTPPSLGARFYGESLDRARISMHTTATGFTQMKAVAEVIGICERP